MALDLEPVNSIYWSGAGGIQNYREGDAPEDMEKFEAIAPVAAIASRGDEGSNSCRDQLTAFAEMTGKEDKAAEVIQEADESIEQLHASIEEPGQNTMLLRVRDDHVRQYLPDSYVGAGIPQRLENIDLVGSAVPSENGEWSAIPPGNIGLLDADRIIAFIDSPRSPGHAESNPLWNKLPAVENGQLYTRKNLTPWILTGSTASSILPSDLEERFSA